MTAEIKRPVWMLLLFDGRFMLGRFRNDTAPAAGRADGFDAEIEYPASFEEHVLPPITLEILAEMKKANAPAEVIAEAEAHIGKPRINLGCGTFFQLEKPREMTLRFQGYWKVKSEVVLKLYEKHVREVELATSNILVGTGLPPSQTGRSAPLKALR